MDIEIIEWPAAKVMQVLINGVGESYKMIESSVFVVYLDGVPSLQFNREGEAIETAKIIRKMVDDGVVDGYIRRVVI